MQSATTDCLAAGLPPSPDCAKDSLSCEQVTLMEERIPHAPGDRERLDNQDSEPKPLFELSQVVGTPGALQRLRTPSSILLNSLHGM